MSEGQATGFVDFPQVFLGSAVVNKLFDTCTFISAVGGSFLVQIWWVCAIYLCSLTCHVMNAGVFEIDMYSRFQH